MLRFGRPHIINVMHVRGGDSFVSNSGHEFRLMDYEAPERHEPGHYESTKELASIIGNKEVSVKAFKRDVYGRFICEAHIGEVDVNHHMQEWLRKSGYQH